MVYLLGVIYKIVSPTGRIYIGQTVDWKSRFASYRIKNCKKQRLLYNSIKKHGWENHKVLLLEFCNFECLDEREIFHVSNENSYRKLNKKGLNLTKGGRGGVTFTNKSVCQYDLDGNFIREWESMKDAAEDTGATIQGISKCCRLQKDIFTAGKFMWRYKLENIILKISPYKITTRKGTTNKSTRKGYQRSNNVPILQYSISGKFIKEWENTSAFLFQSQTPKSSNLFIHLKYPKRTGQAYGFIWRYKTENYPLQIEQFSNGKKFKFCKIKVTSLLDDSFIIYESFKIFMEVMNFTDKKAYDAIYRGIRKDLNLKFESIIEETDNPD